MMAPAKKLILVTGFEPFGVHRVNPSWEAIRRYAGTEVGRASVRAVRLPVEYERGARELEEAIRELRPAAVISFGLGGGSAVRLETTARNSHGGTPDNSGALPSSPELVPGGVATAPSRLPLPAMARLLFRSGIPAEFSDDAGGYVCNAVFYGGLAAAAATVPAGFVHLPQIGGDFTLPRLEEAVLLAVTAAA